MADRFHWGRSREEEPPYERPRERPRLRDEDYAQTDFSRDYGYDPDRRVGYRVADEYEAFDDYGQGDYSMDYAYDAERRRGYRRSADDLGPDAYDPRLGPEGSGGDRRWDERHAERPSWQDRAADERAHAEGRSARDAEDDRRRRRGEPSDRVIWAVVTQRLAHERGLDVSGIQVSVERGEVVLEGLVRDRRDKRRAEDLAEMRGVSHVQNNLRIRRGRFGF